MTILKVSQKKVVFLAFLWFCIQYVAFFLQDIVCLVFNGSLILIQQIVYYLDICKP